MQGPGEGLHEGPALGRGGRGKSANPQPTAGPRGWDRQAAPPRPSGGGARGPEGPRHSPPLPLRPKSGRRQTEETAAPQPPRGGRCTRGEGAPRPRQAPPVNRLHAPALPAADRRQTGGAQDGTNGAAPSEAGLGKAGAQTRAGGFPPPPPPPAALTHWRPTGPRPTPAAPRQPPRHEYTPGGARRRQWMAGRRPPGRGGGGRRSGPSPPPPPPPPSLRATGGTLGPAGAEGTPPLPQKGPRRGGGGGMRLDLHTARPSAPSCLLPRGSRPTGEPTPARRSGAQTKPGGGARRRTRTVWRPRPP